MKYLFTALLLMSANAFACHDYTQFLCNPSLDIGGDLARYPILDLYASDFDLHTGNFYPGHDIWYIAPQPDPILPESFDALNTSSG